MSESGIHPNDPAQLPCDVEPSPEPDHRTLYTINSDRPRHKIIADYARRHGLTVKQIDALVRALPDYGLRSQLHASLAAIDSNVVELAQVRAERARR